ncbi:DUF5958 family protein [Streptomyces gobitricini]|uniref:DUF5958 family protein n=1 Tax=Streptomyces gobitricini TaxID=68211 RepID=UPI0031D1D5F9
MVAPQEVDQSPISCTKSSDAYTRSADLTRPNRPATGEDRRSRTSRRPPQAFRLLIAVLAIADARRRERFCSGGCSHWWHRLSAA